MSLTRYSFVALAAFAVLGACDSKITSIIDTDLQNRVDAVQDCFPNLFARFEDVLEIADSWRTNSGAVIPDPTNLMWVEQMNGSIVVTYNINGTTIIMTIVFYDPNGNAQDLTLPSAPAATLNEAIDAAATELRNLFPSGSPFMVGNWTISGGNISGTGALTGIIGGSTNGNELEDLRTTEVTPAGGPPAVAPCTITDSGPPICSLTITIPSLLTDQVPGQEYPEGVITLSIVGPNATVNGSITFNRTVNARIVIANITGAFIFNLATNAISYAP